MKKLLAAFIILLIASSAFGMDIGFLKRHGGGSVAAASTNIQVDSTDSVQVISNEGSKTWAHTCSGTNRLLFVVITTRVNASTVTSITYNSVDFTANLAWNKADGAGNRSYGFYLVNPATGSHNIVVTFGQSNIYALTSATSFTGVHQSTPVGTATTATGYSATASTTVTSAAGEVVIDGIYASNTPIARDGSQSLLWQSTDAGISGGSSTKLGSDSTVMQWTWTGNVYWAIGAIPLKPAL